MTESTDLAPIQQVREELAPMRAEFGAVLPSHISAEKFTQVCVTALENNPDLLRADRQSFKVACLNAANDGLLPDKREGAFVVFNTEIEVRTPGRAAVEKKKVPMVQWMPMITGILKKAYQTGKVQSISVELVYEKDEYSRAAGDNAEIVHKPLDFGDRGNVRGGYAIIRMRDGGDPYREVVSLADIEKVRAVSRSKDRGPWVTFWDEMAKKTILRRALKRVPLSAEVDQVLARDDVFYNLAAENHHALAAPAAAAIPLNALAAGRAHVRAARAEPVVVESPTVAEGEVEAQVEETPPAESDLIASLTLMRQAPDLAALVACQADASEKATTDEERAWVQETLERRKAELIGSGPFVLKAVISSATGLKEYDDAAVWRDDILTKLAAVSGDAMKKFWAVNLPHVLDAGENGFEVEADHILDVGREKGLPAEMPS